MYQKRYFEGRIGKTGPILKVHFYKTDSGREPVRDWILALQVEDKKMIGRDIKQAQFSWPIGMPLIRKLEADMWEIRSKLKDGIARTLFTIKGSEMILLHGFVKKSQDIPQEELATARERKRKYHEQ